MRVLLCSFLSFESARSCNEDLSIELIPEAAPRDNSNILHILTKLYNAFQDSFFSPPLKFISYSAKKSFRMMLIDDLPGKSKIV